MTCEFNKSIPDCESYIEDGFCKKHSMFRCTDYIAKNEPMLSHSGIMNFIRCPRMYYYQQVRGLKKVIDSDPIKIGSAVDSYITEFLLSGTKNEDYLDIECEIDCMWKAKAIAIMKSFNALVGVDKFRKLFTGQHKFILNKDGQPHVQGILDLHAINNKSFIELKCGRDPSYYTNLFYIKYKLATYFMSNEDYVHGTVWAIRVPDLKRTGKFKDESFNEYSERCYRVMIASPAHYFPGYNPVKKNFGVKFYRVEVGVEEMILNYRMIADWIKICIDRDSWMQNGMSCLRPFQCDYLEICSNNGVISEDIYSFRRKSE